jgi:hypothetical protein
MYDANLRATSLRPPPDAEASDRFFNEGSWLLWLAGFQKRLGVFKQTIGFTVPSAPARDTQTAFAQR